MKYVLVVNDDGVGEESFLQTMHTLKNTLPVYYQVRAIDTAEIIANKWLEDTALLVIPGGSDLLYAKKLNGKGNQNIKNYVKNGGAYLGICAGAYYGSAYVEFDKEGELQVLGKRELAFFPDKTIGPILAKYNYDDNSGARAVDLTLTLEQIKTTTVYYNGGSYFENAENYANVSVIGYYQNRLPAIVHITYEKGSVILSGVHFEYDPDLLNKQDPYLNKIIPALQRSNATRLQLIQEIFKKLTME